MPEMFSAGQGGVTDHDHTAAGDGGVLDGDNTSVGALALGIYVRNQANAQLLGVEENTNNSLAVVMALS